MIYRYLWVRLDDDGRLKLDAILGDAGAQAEIDKNRHQAATTGGFEVG